MSKARKWLLAFGVLVALNSVGIFLRMAKLDANPEPWQTPLDSTTKLALNFLLVICPVTLIVAAFRKEE